MSFDPNEFDRSYASGYVEPLGQYTAKTFLWVMLGLLITFGTALACRMSYFTIYAFVSVPYLPLLALVATMILSFTMARRIERMRVGTAVLIFVLFSVLFGFTLSIYLFVYEIESVIWSFLLTGLYFGALSAYGFLTRRDMSNLRPGLFFGLLFLIAFGLLSMFIPGLVMFDRVACLFGIAVFLAYTAYDTQKIKAFYQYYASYPDMLAKASIFSALQLYLDFLNLFLYLLRFLGNRRR